MKNLTRITLIVLVFLKITVLAGPVEKDEKNVSCQNYKILSVNESIDSKIGIEVGDEIKSFDGKSITTTEQALKVFKLLSSTGKHEVIVERGGKKVSIKYEVAHALKFF